LASLVAALSFTGVYWATDSFVRLALVMMVFSFFWNAALPQFEATTMSHLGKEVHRYSSIRVWGSLGFIVASVAMGVVLEIAELGALPGVLLGLLVAIWLITLTVPEQPTNQDGVDRAEPLRRALFRPEVGVLLLVCFLAQASHGPYYAFFSIYLERLHYEPTLIGGLWSLGVIAEVIVFMLMHRLLPRFGARRLMLAVMALTTLRWLLISGFAANLGILLFAQTLHAFSFGVYHAVAIHLIHLYFTGAHQGRGQALYSSLSFGAGGGLGNLASGYLWAWFGPEVTYAVAAATAALGFVIAWRGLRG
jgi:PPP family 3-phenylpropionic acid transporter